MKGDQGESLWLITHLGKWWNYRSTGGERRPKTFTQKFSQMDMQIVSKYLELSHQSQQALEMNQKTGKSTWTVSCLSWNSTQQGSFQTSWVHFVLTETSELSDWGEGGHRYAGTAGGTLVHTNFTLLYFRKKYKINQASNIEQSHSFKVFIYV